MVPFLSIILTGILSLVVDQSPIEGKQVKNVSAMYILGDSSVDCGRNTLLYSLLHHNLSLVPCNGSDTALLPHLLAKRIGLPYTTPFYSQNGTIEAIQSGLNFGSAQGTIMNLGGSQGYQSLSQQLRQMFETFQLLQLQLGEESAQNFVKSSIFYLSFGKNDYIDLFLQNFTGIMLKYSGQEFARILAQQMSHTMRNLHSGNARKIICTGILPLGCTPRSRLDGDNQENCVQDVNELVSEYNTMVKEQIVTLNKELPGAKITFCDVYRGIIDIINNPKQYGFEDVTSACCGLGRYGAEVGCLSIDMACNHASPHVWWDLYNPTDAVNSILADSAWSNQPFSEFCHPFNVQELVSGIVS